MSTKTAERFGQHEERSLLSCLDDTMSHISNGLSPNAALAKAAKSARLHPDSIPLAVQAYNVGRQTYQREKCAGQGTSCLMGEFPIADPGAVEELMYPKAASILGQRKAASHSVISKDYASPPVRDMFARAEDMKKLASYDLPTSKPVPRNPERKFHYNQLMQLKLASQQASNKLDIALINSKDELTIKLAAVRDWCRKNASQVPGVEWNSNQLFGVGVKELFDHATRDLYGIGRSTGPQTSKQAIDGTQAPYSLVKTALDKVVEYLQDETTIKNAKVKLAREVAAALPFGDGQERTSQVLSSTASSLKEAGLFDSLVPLSIGAVGGQYLKPKTPGELEGGVLKDLEDPEQEAQMRAIKSRAMLSDLLANDDVISGYDPHDVTNAYNEIVQISPHISSQYGLIRSALRKHLTSGEIQPFDAEQMRKIDQSYVPKDTRGKVEL